VSPSLRAGLVAALLLAACASVSPPLPPAPVPAGPGIIVKAEPVPLNSADPSQDRLAGFIYAGGIALTSDQTSRLHGLSDLKMTPDGRFESVSDDGDLLEGRIVLDSTGRLVGVADARLTGLVGQDGQPLVGKFERDAEGLAILPARDRLVSFEHHHRIWLYPAAGGPPRAVPMPDEAFPENDGMEALAALPWVAPDAYVVGAEDTGHTWICRVSATCAPSASAELPPAHGLVAIAPLADGRTGWLMRAWSPALGTRVTLSLRDAAGRELDRAYFALPISVDNFEGLAMIPGREGRLRLYILSDDNFSPSQRTLFLAFDWTPKT